MGYDILVRYMDRQIGKPAPRSRWSSAPYNNVRLVPYLVVLGSMTLGHWYDGIAVLLVILTELHYMSESSQRKFPPESQIQWSMLDWYESTLAFDNACR